MENNTVNALNDTQAIIIERFSAWVMGVKNCES